jgi:hypothetical protein
MTPQAAVDTLNAQGIEARIQHTYFGDEVCVHLYGNSRPAMIYPSVESFMRWVAASPEHFAPSPIR